MKPKLQRYVWGIVFVGSSRRIIPRGWGKTKRYCLSLPEAKDKKYKLYKLVEVKRKESK